MKTIAIMTIAGLATAATAQSVTLDFDLDGVVGNNASVNGTGGSWTVTASFAGFTDSSAYFGGFVGDWNAVGDGAASNLVSLMAGNATTPTASGASITGINIFHSALIGTDDQSNPIAIFTFDTAGTATSLTYGSATGVASMFDNDGIFTLPVEFSDAAITVTSDSLVPAPGALALLGLGGLTAARRRR